MRTFYICPPTQRMLVFGSSCAQVPTRGSQTMRSLEVSRTIKVPLARFSSQRLRVHGVDGADGADGLRIIQNEVTIGVHHVRRLVHVRSRWRHLGTPRLPAGGPCRSPARWQDGASPHQVGDLDSKPDVACGFDSLGTSLPWSRCNPCGKRGCRAGSPDEVNSSTMCSHRVAIKGHECGAVELLRVLVLVRRAT